MVEGSLFDLARPGELAGGGREGLQFVQGQLGLTEFEPEFGTADVHGIAQWELAVNGLVELEGELFGSGLGIWQASPGYGKATCQCAECRVEQCFNFHIQAS